MTKGRPGLARAWRQSDGDPVIKCKLPLAPCRVALPLAMSFGPQSPVSSTAIGIGITFERNWTIKAPLTPLTAMFRVAIFPMGHAGV